MSGSHRDDAKARKAVRISIERIATELDEIKRFLINTLSKPRQHQDRPDKHSRQPDDSKAQASALAGCFAAKSEPSITADRHAAYQKKERFPRLTEYKPVTDLLTLAFLVIYTGVNVFLWCESKKANRIASRALGQQQYSTQHELRPYVVATKMEMVGDFLGNEKFSGKVELINAGHTPATETEGCADVLIKPKTSPITEDYPCPSPENPPAIQRITPTGEHSLLVLGPNIPGFSLSSPGTTVGPSINGKPVTREQKQQMFSRDGPFRLYLYGNVSYQDIVGTQQIHHTNFCGVYNTSTGSFDVCEHHNNVD